MTEILGVLESVFRFSLIIIGLGFIIFIHELGHFIMAKRNGVRVEAFSLGFGPVIWSRKRGDTEYRVSIIPLGGYVKMTGEAIGDDVSGEPHELTSKTGWQRFQIFVAGAIMNLILAFPLCIFSFWVGQWVHNPEVGQVSGPERKADMQLGDILKEVDGTPIVQGEQYRMIMAAKAQGTMVDVVVLRDGQEKQLQVKVHGAQMHDVRPRTTSLADVDKDGHAWKAGFRKGDTILSVGDKEVYEGRALFKILYENPGTGIPFRVRRFDPASGRRNEMTLTMDIPAMPGYPEDEYLYDRVVDTIPDSKSPCYDILEKGDRVVKIGDTEVRSFPELQQALKDNGANEVVVTFMRGTETKTAKITPMKMGDRILLGFVPKTTSRLAHVREDSFYHKAGLRSGDILKGVDGPGSDFTPEHLFYARAPEIVVNVEREVDGKIVAEKLTLKAIPDYRGDIIKLGVPYDDQGDGLPILKLQFDMFYRQWGFFEAIQAGFKEPFIIIDLTYKLLKKLVFGEESAKGLAGPVGIFTVSYRSTELGAGKFFWLLALITVNLGVFNLLPIPVLDGGHVVLLAIEKIRGKPPSENFIIGFQYVGLFFLLALILFVTYNDIERLFRV